MTSSGITEHMRRDAGDFTAAATGTGSDEFCTLWPDGETAMVIPSMVWFCGCSLPVDASVFDIVDSLLSSGDTLFVNIVVALFSGDFVVISDCISLFSDTFNN